MFFSALFVKLSNRLDLGNYTVIKFPSLQGPDINKLISATQHKICLSFKELNASWLPAQTKKADGIQETIMSSSFTQSQTNKVATTI